MYYCYEYTVYYWLNVYIGICKNNKIRKTSKMNPTTIDAKSVIIVASEEAEKPILPLLPTNQCSIV